MLVGLAGTNSADMLAEMSFFIYRYFDYRDTFDALDIKGKSKTVPDSELMVVNRYEVQVLRSTWNVYRSCNLKSRLSRNGLLIHPIPKPKRVSHLTNASEAYSCRGDYAFVEGGGNRARSRANPMAPGRARLRNLLKNLVGDFYKVPQDFGYDYYFPALGQCAVGQRVGRDNCTWRTTALRKSVNAVCMRDHIKSAVKEISKTSTLTNFTKLVDACVGGDPFLMSPAVLPRFRSKRFWASVASRGHKTEKFRDPVTKDCCEASAVKYLLFVAPSFAFNAAVWGRMWRGAFEACPAVESGEDLKI